MISKLISNSRASLAYTRRTLGLVYRSSKGFTYALLFLTLVGAFVPLAVAYTGKRIVDSVLLGSRDAATRYIFFEFLLVLLLALVQRGLGVVRGLLGARLGIDINVAILAKAVGLELRYFEDAKFYDQLTRARREASSRPVSLVTESFQLVQSTFTLLGFAVLLSRFSAVLVVGLLLATLPATIAEMRYAKAAFRMRNWRAPETRKLMYLEFVLANDEHAKEVKLFGIGKTLLGRYQALAEGIYTGERKLAFRRAAVTQAMSLLGTGAFYAAYVLMGIAAASGKLTLGELTLYILAFRQGQQAFQSALGSIGSIYEHNLYMSNLYAFFDLAAPEARSTERPALGAATEEKEKGLRFENVGFRYEGKEAWALRGVDLFIARGESFALVGENGAGKTTLIKLLTRLYRPSEGRITLDGIELDDWPLEDLRARIGVVFQDFNHYQLAARENVGFGSVEHLADQERIERAVDKGGARELVKELADGLDTQLGRWFEEGAELSGGQWQKLALARAFMREEADILVLDEPTAALDAESEHAVFSRFRELAKGRTTIVISHRFPAVRMAQHIVVLEKGKIVESGTHDALVAARGKYAHMFEMQAEGYR